MTKRCKPRTCQDWNKIAHVQHLDLDNSSSDSGNIYKKIPSLLFLAPSFNSFFFCVGCIYFPALLNLLTLLLLLLIIMFISFVLNEILFFFTFCLVNSISIAILSLKLIQLLFMSHCLLLNQKLTINRWISCSCSLMGGYEG